MRYGRSFRGSRSPTWNCYSVVHSPTKRLASRTLAASRRTGLLSASGAVNPVTLNSCPKTILSWSRTVTLSPLEDAWKRSEPASETRMPVRSTHLGASRPRMLETSWSWRPRPAPAGASLSSEPASCRRLGAFTPNAAPFGAYLSVIGCHCGGPGARGSVGMVRCKLMAIYNIQKRIKSSI